MKVVVTGGAGFIGSHLVERLIGAGHTVHVVDDLSTGKRENLANVSRGLTVQVGDVRNPAVIAEAVAGAEVVFHEAAIVSVTRSVEEPAETQSVNLGGTVQVLRAAARAGVRRVVFASSAAVYGAGDDAAKDEQLSVTKPQSPYGLEKLTGEEYLRLWHELHGLETVALRYFNVFGNRQDPSSPYSGVISIFADRISRGEAPTIYGDGEQTRDFVHVDNVVEANMRAMTASVPHGIFNVASGDSISLNVLFGRMCRAAGVELTPRYAAARAGDIRHSSANIKRAQASLGYQPVVSLDDGLQRLLRPSPRSTNSTGSAM